MKKFIAVFWMLLITSLLTGCASISLVDSWKDPGASAQRYRKLLIVGIAEKRQMRQVFEEVFAAELTKKGVAAVPSYPLTGFEIKPTRAALEQAVSKSGADGVITTRLVALKKDTEAKTGFIMTDKGFSSPNFADPTLHPYNMYDFYGGSVAYAEFKHQSVEVTMKTIYSLQTNLFDAGTSRLVWTGLTSAVNPEGIITLTDEVAEVVIKAMAQAGLL
jgi:hypothetical protein